MNSFNWSGLFFPFFFFFDIIGRLVRNLGSHLTFTY